MERPPRTTMILMVLYAAAWLVLQPFAEPVVPWMVLDPHAVLSGQLWRLVTFPFVDDLYGVLFTLLGLYFFASPVERSNGPRALLRLWFASLLLAGALFSLLSVLVSPGILAGTEAGSFALLAAFAGRSPGAQLLAYFVIPVKAVHLLGFIVVLQFLKMWQVQRIVWPMLVPMVGIPLGWQWARGGGFQGLNPLWAWRRWRMKTRAPHLDVLQGGRDGGNRRRRGPDDYLQ